MPRDPPDELRRELSNAALAVGALYKSAKTAYNDGYTDALRLVKNFVLITQYCQRQVSSSCDTMDSQRSQRKTGAQHRAYEETPLVSSSYGFEDSFERTSYHRGYEHEGESRYHSQHLISSGAERGAMHAQPMSASTGATVDTSLLLSFVERHMRQHQADASKSSNNNNNMSTSGSSGQHNLGETQQQAEQHHERRIKKGTAANKRESQVDQPVLLGREQNTSTEKSAPIVSAASSVPSSTSLILTSTKANNVASRSSDDVNDPRALSTDMKPVTKVEMEKRARAASIATRNGSGSSDASNDARRQHNEVIACAEVDPERFCRPPPRKRRRTRVQPAAMWASWMEAMHLGSEDDTDGESNSSSDSSECGLSSESSTSALKDRAENDDL